MAPAPEGAAGNIEIGAMQLNVLEYLEHGALRRSPDEPAVIDGQKEYTFKAIDTAAKRLALEIIRKRDILARPIAVFLPKSAATIIADLAIVYSGNAYMNLDVKSPVQRLRNILGNIDPVLIITSDELADTVALLGVESDRIVTMSDARIDSTPEDDVILSRLPRVIDTDPLCIINTSGSTGIPKGVAMHHRSVIDFMDWVMDRFDFDGSEVIGSLSPFVFDIYTLELFLCLAKGATLVIIPDLLATFPAKLVQFLADKQISFLFWVPSIMVSIANQGVLSTVDLKSLKRVFFAGEVFPMKQLNIWRRHLPEALFVNLYGPIEITVDCTYFVVDREFGDDEMLPIGVPCRNTDVLILTEKNQAAAVNEPGELCIRGSSLALGYWNDHDKTAKAFVQNPLNHAYPELVYRTGDLGYWNERGEIMFLGRKDYQIKHLGYRIELGEIETAVATVDWIHQACVLYDAPRKAITLFYESPSEAPPAKIRQELAKVLPKYMLPTEFHYLQSMPRNPNGKIDRQKLSLTFTEEAHETDL